MQKNCKFILILFHSAGSKRELKMPGLKKLKKGKKFNYGRNRSRVRKQQEKTSKFNVATKIDCLAMKVGSGIMDY